MSSQDTDYRTLAEDLGIRGQMAGNNLVGRCPLHRDRRPSFSLNVGNGLWICFSGCGQGNFPKLVREVLGVTAREADVWIAEHRRAVDGQELARLLEQATVPAEESSRVSEGWRTTYEGLSDNVLPVWYFQRGFTWTTADAWGIRWDSERERLVVPVRDHRGDLVGTVSRQTRSFPKYVNSPGLPAKKILFGLCPNDEKLPIIIVEGVLDALWLRQLGHRGVALLGTTLSFAQVRLLQAWGPPRIYLALDNDQPGKAAQAEHLRTLRAAGWARLWTVAYPAHAKDVQDCNEEEVKRMIEEAKEV